jgi:hypothetical protein
MLQLAGRSTSSLPTDFIGEGSSASAFKAIPEKYRSGSMDRQIDVAAGTTQHPSELTAANEPRTK